MNSDAATTRPSPALPTQYRDRCCAGEVDDLAVYAPSKARGRDSKQKEPLDRSHNRSNRSLDPKLLVTYRTSRAIVASDANTDFSTPSSQITKKNSVMHAQTAADGTDFVPRCSRAMLSQRTSDRIAIGTHAQSRAARCECSRRSARRRGCTDTWLPRSAPNELI